AHLGRKKRELVPGKQIPAESKADHDEEQEDTAEPGDLARRVICAQKENAEQVNEQRRNHQIRGPAMNRANQPAEFYFGDNELDALEGVLGAGTIIEKKQDSGCDLDGEEKERHPAKVVPDRLAVDWDFLLFGHGGERANRKTLVKPFCQEFYFHERPRVLFSLARRLESVSEPRAVAIGS